MDSGATKFILQNHAHGARLCEVAERAVAAQRLWAALKVEPGTDNSSIHANYN